ncbi:hypothetical protein SAMN05444392_101136 [Seinonella peptonophila]|uniref:DUF397 domain-containing protein n=2 Tax=Seinonella peptonophila TaxID=112248 RepID=A0A1M4SUC4_9BACL|nr:hypothetical protein SAMN05444392_101136 [Seinonella peptonophila]
MEEPREEPSGETSMEGTEQTELKKVIINPIEGGVEFKTSNSEDPSFFFTYEEWEAFKAGVEAGEFDLSILALFKDFGSETES